MKAREIFGKRLEQARLMAGLTQAELASRARINQGQLSHFENGRRGPSIENFRKLSLVLDVSADYLLGMSTSPERKEASSILGSLTMREKALVRDIIGCIANGRKSVAVAGETDGEA